MAQERNASVIKIGLISGFFNPIHPGHIDLINDARSKCDYLIVVVNNDEQVKKKGACPFLDQESRLKIIQNLQSVNMAVIAEDDIGTTIEKIKPDIIFQGADRQAIVDVNPQEVELAKRIGAEIVLCTGGDEKVTSSSKLIEEGAKWYNSYDYRRT